MISSTKHKSSVSSARWFLTSLLVGVVMMSLWPTLAAASAIDKTFVTFERLNIRTGASTATTILGVAPRFTAGIIQSEPVAAGGFTWYQVRFFNGDFGWVAGEYIFILEDYLASAGRTPTATTIPTPVVPPLLSPPPPLSDSIKSIFVRFDGILDWEIVARQPDNSIHPDSPITHQDVITEVFAGDLAAYISWITDALNGSIVLLDESVQTTTPITNESRLINFLVSEIAEFLDLPVPTVIAITTFNVSCDPFSTCPIFEEDTD